MNCAKYIGNEFSVLTKTLPKTGTQIAWVKNAAGETINKTVIPGAKNKVGKYITSISTNYAQGKPIQSAIKQSNFAMTFANKAETNTLEKSDFFRPGDLNNKETSKMACNRKETKFGTEVLELRDKIGDLISKHVFPSKNCSHNHISSISTNFAQGKPIQSTIKQGDYAMTFANDAKTNALKTSDFFRPGDLS